MSLLKRIFWPDREDDARTGEPMLERVEPLEGTSISLFNTIIPNWYAENLSGWVPGGADLAERVWVANRCVQLNSQQIATMPVAIHNRADTEPAWLSSPDPHWYPNGLADALFAVVENIYGWGYSCQLITDRYADGYPRTWTVIDNNGLNITREDGSRVYKIGEERRLNPNDVVQIDRNPGSRVKGTSALRAYAQNSWQMLAAGNQAMTVTQGGTPKFYLQSERKLTSEQADALRDEWMTKTAARNGAPPILPPEIEAKEMSFDPSDLALLETQEFNAKAIATAFGVPATLLNMALQGGLTYQNPAALGEMWWRFELRTLATRIANAWSAQLLPAGQYVTFDAADTFAPLTEISDDDDPQASQVAKASPAQQPLPQLAAIGGTP